MNKSGRIAADTTTSSTAKSLSLGVILLRVAWLSVLLGLGMEALLLLFAAGSGLIPGLGEIVAASVQKISWAVIVCTGIALGTTVSSIFRAPLMGMLGFLAAPVAFHVARTLHQGTKEALEITGGVASIGESVFLIALIKRVEYACLAALIGWIGTRPWGGISTSHLGRARHRNTLWWHDPGPHVRVGSRASIPDSSHLPGHRRSCLPRRLLSSPVLCPGFRE